MNLRLRAAACLVLPIAVVGLAGCTSDPGDPVVTADCDPAEEQPLQEGSHLLGDQAPPVPYNSRPPTSGWHSSGRPPEPGAHSEPVSEPQQVLHLEQGGIVIAYEPSLPAEVQDRVQAIPEEVDGVVVTPYGQDMPSPIALTAWGVLQRCTSVTAADVAAFREAHAVAPDH